MYTVSEVYERERSQRATSWQTYTRGLLSKDTVIISAYEAEHNIEERDTKIFPLSFIITSKEDPRCPYCGTLLEFEDHVRRHRRLVGGEKEWYWIERRSCPAGCGLHWILPDFPAPHKHYDIDIITGGLNGEITSNMLAFEDYPCERTMERWNSPDE